MARKLGIVLVLLCALIGLASPSAAQDAGILSHYIVFEQDANGAAQPVFYRQVVTHARFYDEAAAAITPDRISELIGVRLIDADGTTRYSGQTSLPVWIRGEFHGEGGTIDEHRFLDPKPSFVVRAPLITGTRLVLENSAASAMQVFDPAAIAVDDTLALADYAVAADAAFDAPQDTGSSANRVDLLVMGDGYTSAQQTLFETHFAEFDAQFFGIFPHDEYRSYMKVERIFTASAGSGADHPPYNAACVQGDPYAPTCCLDTSSISDPLSGTFVATAFDATFCSFNIQRLLVVNSTKLYAAAAAYPNWDQLMVMVNDSTYGGAGGRFSTFSRHSLAVQIAQHELGHSFARLADEYSSAYPGFPRCTDVPGTVPPGYTRCEPNVTDLTARASIKWLRWIDDDTPTITPPNSPYTNSSVSGLFDGARYDDTPGYPTYYRPGFSCIMRFLGVPYCEAAAEAFALRFYQGQFGQGSQPAIRPIEPGTASPSNTNVTMQVCAVQDFSAQLLAPLSGSQVRWSIDGVSQEDYTAVSGLTLYFAVSGNGLGIGTHSVALTVTDGASVIHPTQMALATETRTWTVNVINTACSSANVQPQYQGRPTAPNAAYVSNVRAVLMQGGGVVTDTALTTDQYGRLTLSYYQPGSYTLWVKGSHTLASSIPVTLAVGDNIVGGLTLREGDANNDNVVNITDFSILAGTFGKTSVTVGFDARADFNNDGVVNISDFSLLAGSFGMTGALLP
ncbi:MAG: M64 family metallopeptidase [Chloroflexota bacterium]|nr:M64 family metallopeptidase [Chloroflexota bacterium]